MDEQAFTTFIGLDVSKDRLDLCLRRSLQEPAPKATLQVSNDRAGFARLLKWLSKRAPEREACVVCLEHTGLYMEGLLDTLTLAGYACAVVKTRAIEQVRPEHHRKDDAYDAALLAEYAMRFLDRLSLYRPPHPAVERVRLLHQERRRLVTQRASVKQLLAESPRRRTDTAFAESLWREQLSFYDRQIKAIEQELRATIEGEEELRQRFEQMRSVEGFGEQAALLWVSLFYGRTHLRAREVASWLGLAPHGQQSGNRKRNAFSTGHGDSEARKVLAMCAQSLAQHRQRWRQYLEKKRSEGKPYRLVMNNISNKLIHIACAVWNEGSHFDPRHISRYDRLKATPT